MLVIDDKILYGKAQTFDHSCLHLSLDLIKQIINLPKVKINPHNRLTSHPF